MTKCRLDPFGTTKSILGSEFTLSRLFWGCLMGVAHGLTGPSLLSTPQSSSPASAPFLPVWRSKRSTYYGNVAGWLDVTRRYCIKTAKPIVKLFNCHSSFLWPLRRYPIPRGRNPFSGDYIYTGVGKIDNFQRKSPFISETVRDRPMVTMER